MQVANLSLGSPMGSVFMRLAVDYAASRGVAVICAAGNSGGSVGYPAAYESAIAVAASDSQDKIASFSSRGREVDLIAPGVGVQSTIPGGGYDSYNGTSMATPHVAGLAALAVARGARGPAGVRAALTRAASSIGLSPKEQGKGLVDAARLVQ
jgi:subtilisin